MDTLYERIMLLCNKKGIKGGKLCTDIGISKGIITDLKMGRTKSLSFATTLKIANYFEVSVGYLLGEEEKKKKVGVKIPVYGNVAAGIPIEAWEDILDYEEIDEDMAQYGEYFALKIKGDSMEPKISDGDVVIVACQSDVDSGQIAIVLVNGNEATCKKIKKTPEGVYLISTNPEYDPMFFNNKEIEELPIRILGRVVELRAKF